MSSRHLPDVRPRPEAPVRAARSATDERRLALDRRASLLLAVLFGIVAVLTAVDLAIDLGHGIEPAHAVAEGLVVLAGLGGATWMIARLNALSRQARDLGLRAEALAADLRLSREALASSRADAERWRSEVRHLTSGLGEAIDRQFGSWGLSSAEQEVALLLLKGLSHKEIADVRGTSEATVRQQSAAIYRKAALDGRHDLAAFFLEDLLAPRGTDAPRG